MADDLERQRDFYRQQSNELGARLLRSHEEQIRARQEARRSRTATRLIRDLYRLTDSNISLNEIGQRFLQIVLDTLIIDRGVLWQYLPLEQRYVPLQSLGFASFEPPGIVPPEPPSEYHFANSSTTPTPFVDCLRKTIGVPYFLWAFNPRAGLALLLGNAVEDQHVHRPFEAADQEIIEGALSVFIDINARKMVEAQVQASLEEKVVLLKEIHHRVKNNLQVMSSLLYLQSQTIQDSASLETFKESQNRIKSMALIHEKLYQSSDLARIDFAEYVRSLAGYLHHSYSTQTEEVSLKLNIEDISLDIDTAIPCGLIINELTSNALKYAFPEGVGRNGKTSPEIRIALGTEEGEQLAADSHLTLIVSDNGIGFPPEVDFQRTTSLGLQLVNRLVNQLDGTIALHRQEGTTFRIEFRAKIR